MGARYLSSAGLRSGNLIERAKFFPVPAPDKNRSPILPLESSQPVLSSSQLTGPLGSAVLRGSASKAWKLPTSNLPIETCFMEVSILLTLSFDFLCWDLSFPFENTKSPQPENPGKSLEITIWPTPGPSWKLPRNYQKITEAPKNTKN